MNGSRSHLLTIRTPEGIDFALLLASPVTRCLAVLIDFMVVTAALSLLSAALMLLGVLSPDVAAAVRFIVFFAVQIGYAIVCEWWWRGQTLGKRILRLRVVDATGLRLQFSQVVIRNLLRFVDSLPAFYLVGGLAALLNSRSQRLGDLAANTVVIRTPQIVPPDLDQILAGKFNSLRLHPHLEARLRQKIAPTEAGLALQALVRREEFAPEARVRLFARLAEHYRGLVEFPADTVEGITDEQYVRNVVDTLFRPRTKAA